MTETHTDRKVRAGDTLCKQRSAQNSKLTLPNGYYYY